jgi:hypothetical protein
LTRGRRSCRALLAALALLVASACNKHRPTKVPGETDIGVTSVTLQSPEGSKLTPNYKPLMDRLGMRPDSLILPGRYYSEFRENEDRRRLTAFWQNYGFFDVDVERPKTVFDETEKTVAVTWTIRENERYRIEAVHMVNPPEEEKRTLEEMIPFAPGESDIDLERFRKVRVTMHDYLRDQGYGHARVYSRVFVDRGGKQLHWYYYVDAGPKTRVGKVVVEGNNKIPAELILDRVGLESGDPYAYADKIQREFDLLDTGAFGAAFIRTTADTKFIVPGDAPDTGGVMRDESVDDDGNFVPRELPEEIDLKIHVREAPSQQLRVRAGAQLDPTRVDTTLRTQLWLRNLFGPLHHMTFDGRIGYGVLYRSVTDDPTGVYGDAELRYLRPGLIGRLGDFRFTGRFRQQLFPGFHLREVNVGPGVRTTMAKGLFFDLDLYFRYGEQIDFGPFEAATRDAFSLADDDVALSGELQSSITWDKRDNPLEALRGHLLALRTTAAPGDPVGTHGYWTLNPEARLLLPVGSSMAVGLRGNAGWVVAHGSSGVPLGPRWFGGGAYGVRGFGLHQLSPKAPECRFTPEGQLLVCQGTPVGGLSLAQFSLEGRFLPLLKPYGAVVFADAGGAGTEANPFEDGVALALGLGLRLRFWYLPAAIDVGYRLLEESELQEPVDDPFAVFFRLGEAF